MSDILLIVYHVTSDNIKSDWCITAIIGSLPTMQNREWWKNILSSIKNV